MFSGTFYRAELYDNSKAPYKTLDEVYNLHKDRYPGKRCYVSNAHWFNAKGKPVGNYRVNGETKSEQYADCIGMGWSGFEKPSPGWWSALKTKDNFACTMPMIMDGTLLDVSAAKYGASVVRTCAVTGFGFYANGDYCGTIGDIISTAALQAQLQAAGVRDYLRLDSGTSCQGRGPDLYVRPQITVFSFFIVWLEPETDEAGDTEDKLAVLNSGLEFAYELTKRTLTNLLVLHHEGDTGEHTVEEVHKAHLDRGWAGIAYHYYVQRDGSIYRGRPEDTIGGHTQGYNSTSIGICAEGNFETELMPAVQQAALTKLVADIRRRYPGFTIKRHLELNTTACPGKNYPYQEIACVPESQPSITAPTDYVAIFQRWLNTRFYAGLTVDGIYGTKTKRAAIQAYQRTVGVTADGIFGPITKAAAGSMGYGSTGTGVFILQGLLYGNGLDPNGFDGRFGAGTQRAVMAYQRAMGLVADGIAGKNTFEKLFT